MHFAVVFDCGRYLSKILCSCPVVFVSLSVLLVLDVGFKPLVGALC